MSLSVDRIDFSILNVPPKPPERESVLATTKEFREIHPIYQAILEAELKHVCPLPQSVSELLNGGAQQQPSGEIDSSVRQWLALLDLAVSPHMMRTYIKEHGAEDSTLRAL